MAIILTTRGHRAGGAGRLLTRVWSFVTLYVSNTTISVLLLHLHYYHYTVGLLIAIINIIIPHVLLFVLGFEQGRTQLYVSSSWCCCQSVGTVHWSVRTYVRMYMCVYTCICVYMCIYIYIYMHMYVCINVCMYVCM